MDHTYLLGVARLRSPFTWSTARCFGTPTESIKRSRRNTSIDTENLIARAQEQVGDAENLLVVLGGRKMVDIFTAAAIDQQTGSLFKYEELDGPYDIRIVDLLPGSGPDDLSCEIVPLDLEDPSHLPYHAVSYMWDDENQEVSPDDAQSDLRTEEILCQNGTYLKISKNLSNFLRRVRHPELRTPLWIDQISINQSNQAEREHQVSIMQHVYQKAHWILFWIGEEDEHTAVAFGLVKKLAAVDPSGMADASPIALLDPAYTEAAGLPCFPGHEWEALSRLFKRKVFQRTWIIQEVALARGVDLMCGSHSLDYFATFAPVARKIVNKGWFRMFVDAYGPECRPSFIANHFNRRLMVAMGEHQSLSLLLGATRRFQATWPVDKVYGLLGLSQVKNQQLEAVPLAPALVPDYSKPVEVVYNDVTFHIMVSENSLDLLSTVSDGSCRKLDKLPTWVPDYSIWENKTILGLGIPYRACGDSHVCLSRGGRNNEILYTKAIKLGNIRAASRPWLLGIWALQIYSDWSNFFREELERSGLTLINNIQDIARTMIGDYAISAVQYPAPAFEYLRHFAAVSIHINELQGVQTEGVESVALGDSALYIESFQHISCGRKAFMSQDGRMGLANLSVKEGDAIYIFSGGRLPYVLRPTADGESFEFLGECYLHGIMNGEAVQAEDPRWTTISIV